MDSGAFPPGLKDALAFPLMETLYAPHARRFSLGASITVWATSKPPAPTPARWPRCSSSLPWRFPDSMKDIRRLAQGPWGNDDFVVMKPGRAILASPFPNLHAIRLLSANGSNQKEDSHASWSPLGRQSKPLAGMAPTLWPPCGRTPPSAIGSRGSGWDLRSFLGCSHHQRGWDPPHRSGKLSRLRRNLERALSRSFAPGRSFPNLNSHKRGRHQLPTHWVNHWDDL